MKDLKIAYIGGGSKEWANVLMADLALTDTMCGEIALYDIDKEASVRNSKIGALIADDPKCVSKWRYTVSDTLKDALIGADFVICSILPATFDEMEFDVHAPEKYGIYQPVGDTVGAGGVLRAMRTVPIYEGFAQSIEQYCPQAFVINLTNPMSICTKTLYDVFPKIKAFGCCHEVFHAQDFLACVAKEVLGVARPNRHQIQTDASGVNHFTWITEASLDGQDLLELLPAFADRFFESGYCERADKQYWDYKDDVFLYSNRVKMDMFFKYGALGGAGDRHLVEFMPNTMYLKDKETIEKWGFHLTPVSFRKHRQEQRIAQSKLYASGRARFELNRSDEELVDILEALLGLKRLVANVNIVNHGQMPQMPNGAIVETNCVFQNGKIQPIKARELPKEASEMVLKNLNNIEKSYEGIKKRDLNTIFQAFINQPLLSQISKNDAQDLFVEMINGTRKYLEPYFNLRDL